MQLASAGEAGVAVSLLNASGSVVASTTTDSTGTYTFNGLAAGNYQVKYTAPAGQVLATGSEADPTSGLTPVIAVPYNNTVTVPVEQWLANGATIQSSVLYYSSPTATTGTADAGVTVSLLNAAGTVLATTVTNASGAFSFGNVAPGTYQLQYTPPGGQTFDPAGLANGLTAPFTVADGQTVTAPAGTMVPLASIDGTVLLDGTGEAGVTVSVLTATGTLVATATTNSTGAFAFTDLLAAGSYEVKYTAPSGQVLATGSEAIATTGLTPTLTLATSQVLTLPSELLLSNPATIEAYTLHFDAPTDPHYGTKIAGVTVSLLNAAGQVIATAVSTTWSRRDLQQHRGRHLRTGIHRPVGRGDRARCAGEHDDRDHGAVHGRGRAGAGRAEWLAGVAVEPDRNGAAGECRGGRRCGVAAERQRQRRREHDDRQHRHLHLQRPWPLATTR